MKHDTIDGDGLSYAPCRYGMSRVFFRGPKRNLDEPYIAFIGGTETYGKFIERPLPVLVEQGIGRTCVNLGCVNGGVDAFVNDPTLVSICNEADATVVQVMGANFLSNRFYSVHPRRNDRFLRASTVMKAIFKEVDFSEFTFTRAMLGALHSRSPERFDIVVQELREAWLARMKNLLGQIGSRVILLWLSKEPPSDEPWDERERPLLADPLFITASMIEELRPLCLDVVDATPSETALDSGTRGMVFSAVQSSAAAAMLGAACHQEAALKVTTSLRRALKEKRAA